MTLAIILYWIKEGINWAQNHRVFVLWFLGIIIVLSFVLGFSHCGETEIKTKRSDEILTDKIETNVLVNKQIEVNANVKKMEVNSNSAYSNYNAARKRGSDTFSNREKDAGDAYCKRYPDECWSW